MFMFHYLQNSSFVVLVELTENKNKNTLQSNSHLWPIVSNAWWWKERVEESLYIKQQEEAWKEKLRALRAQEASQRKAEEHKVVVEPVMKDIADLLKASGDSVSDAGLEALAKWKLSL
jgi:hypothetical protein